AQDDDPVLGADVETALRQLRIAENDALDLARQRDVVERRVVAREEVNRLLRQAIGAGGRTARRPVNTAEAATERGAAAVAEHVAASPPHPRIEQEHQSSAGETAEQYRQKDRSGD